MLEASLISAQLTDLRISEGDQCLLYLRNLPEKVQEFAQLHCAATTVTKLWEAVNSYYVRMRMTGDLDKVHEHKASLQQQLDQMWCATIVAERVT